MEPLTRLRNARLLDPVTGREERGDLVWREGRIAPPCDPVPGEAVIEANGLLAVPALLDLHVHLREPGGEAAETIETGTRAAAAGGFGTVVAMPNTQPPLDAPDRVRHQIERAQAAGFARVLPSACLTAGRDGRRSAPLETLREAGAVAFTDDGSTVADERVLRDAMRRAAAMGRPVMDHAQDREAERRGVMHDGSRARELGLPGIPAQAECSVVERDIRLAEATGCRVHIQHLTSGRAAALVRAAKSRRAPVSCELTPHHLALCDADIPGDDANYKMNPPLRSAEDRDALRTALADGTIDCFATDHAPHAADRKALGFRGAPFGVIGLETAVGVTWTQAVRSGALDALQWLRLWTTAPAAILGLPPPSLAPGSPADIAVLDLDTPWTVDPNRFVSRSRNTCFSGWTLFGRCVYTIHRGRKVWDADARA
jgi:dihydroorotase